MRTALLISFDFFRKGDPRASYPLACLKSAVAAEPSVGRRWQVETLSIDLRAEDAISIQGLAALIKRKARAGTYDAIALGDYCWSSWQMKPLIAWLRSWQPKAAVACGGYQVTSTPPSEFDRYYPSTPPITLIKGFAENSLTRFLGEVEGGGPLPRELETGIVCRELVSPWLDGSMPLDGQVEKVRWETKRGCQYQCDYCEFKSATNSPRRAGDMVLARDRLLAELALFKKHGVKKVNVLDPLFNIEGTYEELLEPMLRTGMDFTLQTRIERLEGQDALIEAAANNPRLRLEIGVQTLDEGLNRLLCRANQKDRILSTLGLLRTKGISFETNLIFGIPGQTAAAHVEDIESLVKAGCPKPDIRSFPLRIPRGSGLEAKRAALHVVELPALGSDRLVLKADGFDLLDWQRMLLASLAEEPYLDRLKDSVSKPENDPLGRRGRMSWAIDTETWIRALFVNRFVFRVMLVNRDGTATSHGEYTDLEFLWPIPMRRTFRRMPGSAHAMKWVLPLLDAEMLKNVPTDYVMLRRRLMWREYERPARVLCHDLDVAGQAVVLWVTWSIPFKDQLRLLRTLATAERPPPLPLPPQSQRTVIGP